jgi:multiple sugar transport system substrate-binding protein
VAVVRRGLAGAAAVLALLTACGPPGTRDVQLTVWAHSGQPGERAALTRAVATFERAHPHVDVALRVVPEGDYGDVVQTAIVADELPDVLDLDGPRVASYASQQALRPLDDLLPRALVDDLLASVRTQGTWRDRLWALGTFDSGLVLYADRRALRAAGVRVPTGLADPWTSAELSDALRRLAARDPDGKVLDLRVVYGAGEWMTFGFAPLVYSAGGTLLDPAGRAEGAMDGPAAVRALTLLGAWARYVDPDPRSDAFVQRRVPLSWVGHWTYPEYRKALGSDLVVLPLPDLGNGTKSAQGSWAWGVSARSRHPREAAQLLAWFASDDNVLAMTASNGAVPGTESALARSPAHQAGQPLALFAEQLERTCGSGPVTRSCVAVPRPVTPVYPLLTTAFAQAVREVIGGADPATALRSAAATVERALASPP